MKFKLRTERLVPTPKPLGEATRSCTIGREELNLLSILGSKKVPRVVNMDGRRKRWIGVGWADDGDPCGNETIVVDGVGGLIKRPEGLK